MKLTHAAALSALAGLVLASSADAAPPRPHSPGLPQRQCFQTRDIESHVIASPSTMYVRLRNRAVYRIVGGRDCFAAALRDDPIVVRTRGVDMVCRPIDLDLSLVHRPRCLVRSIDKLSPAEVAAIPKKLRP